MKNQVPWEMFEPPNDLSATVARSVVCRPPLHESLIFGWVVFGLALAVSPFLPAVFVLCLGASSMLGLGALLIGRSRAWWLFAANFLVWLVIAAVLDYHFTQTLKQLEKIFKL